MTSAAVVEIEDVKYTRGSGPPPKKPWYLPAHDKKGVILGEIQLKNGSFNYIVGHEDHPAMRREVPVLKISDYVSNYELEQYTFRQDRKRKEERRAQEEREKAAKTTAKIAKQAAKLKKYESRVDTPKSKRKSTEDDADTLQPRKKQAVHTSKSRATSSSTSVRSPNQRGLSEVESGSDFDEVSTAILIAKQLRGFPQVEVTSRSPSASTSTSGNCMSFVGDPHRRSVRLSTPAVAAISSIDAAAIWEEMEKKKKGKGNEVM